MKHAGREGRRKSERRRSELEGLEERALLAGTPWTVDLQDGVNAVRGADAQMNRDFPTASFGGSEEIFASYRSASALRWEVSHLPDNAVVTAVELTLNVTNSSKDSFALYQLKKDWTETGLGWTHAAGDTPWQAAGASGAADRASGPLATFVARTPGAVTIRFNAAGVAAVQSWIRDASTNFGVVLQNYAANDALGFSAREAANAALRPKLTVTYTVPENKPPVVDAGVDQAAFVSETMRLAGAATDDGQPTSQLTTAWTKVSGPGTVAFGNAAQPDTTVKFSAAGVYVLRLTASDGKLTTSDEVSIQVADYAWGVPPLSAAFQNDESYSGGRDAQMNRDFPTTNFGSSSEIFASYRSASALAWDLSRIPADAQVTSVKLTLNVTNSSRDQFELFALLRSWSEGDLTWRNATGGAWQTAGATGAADRGAESLGSIATTATGVTTITLNARGIAVVQDWIKRPETNRGFILQNYAGQDSLGFSSNEATNAALRPKLTVNYTLPPVVDAGADRTTNLPDKAALAGKVTLPGVSTLPAKVTTRWTLVSGPGAVTFGNTAAVETTASFSQAGTYVLRLTASNGVASVSDELRVTAAAPATPSAGVWLTRGELMALPTSGAAWDSLVKAANTKANQPDLSNQSDNTDQYTLAKALVGVRTNNAALIAQARANIMKAIGTEVGGSTLGFSRNLPAYIIAADLIGLNGADDVKFRSWLRDSLSAVHSGRSIRSTHEDRPNNWGTMAGAARAAIAVYLGDQAELARAAQVFKGWLGDRGSYAGFKYGDLDWQADPNRPVGINPKGATKEGRSIDGALPEEMRRGGEYDWPPTFTDYAWEGLQGAFVQAEILYRAGYDAYQWSDQALLRATKFLYNTLGWAADGDDEWQPWLINARYGTNYAAAPDARFGKIMGWTNWTHASLGKSASGFAASELQGVGMSAALLSAKEAAFAVEAPSRNDVAISEEEELAAVEEVFAQFDRAQEMESLALARTTDAVKPSSDAIDAALGDDLSI